MSYYNYPYWCGECERGFNSERALEQHNEALEHYESESDDEWECKYCERVCSSEEAIVQHTRACHSDLEHECYTCHQRFATKGQMFKHRAEQHQALVRQPAAPTIAAPSVASIAQMVHSTVHDAVQSLPPPRAVEVPQQLIACNTVFCGAKFTSVEARDLHIFKIHQHTCVKCSKVFASADLLFAHQEAQHQSRCTAANCNAHFDNIEELNTHLRHLHQHQCDKCPSHFPDMEALFKHRDTVHQYLCYQEGCGASFGSSEDRKSHLLSTSHNLACDKCEVSFKSTETLLAHRDKVHMFRCDHEGCSALFDTPEIRSLHSRTSHRHKCDRCKKFFPNIEHLLEHRDLSHRFSCNANGCNAQFLTPEGLDSHSISHQHTCKECPKLLSCIEQLSVRKFRCEAESCGGWFDSEGLEGHTVFHETMMAKQTQDTHSDEGSFYDAGENATSSTADSSSDPGNEAPTPPSANASSSSMTPNKNPVVLFQTMLKELVAPTGFQGNSLSSAARTSNSESTIPRSSFYSTSAGVPNFMEAFDELAAGFERFSLGGNCKFGTTESGRTNGNSSSYSLSN